MNKSKNILMLDMSSESNIGDIALQEGLICLINRHYPDAKLSATTIFGANQLNKSYKHFKKLINSKYIFVGGALRPTFYPTNNKNINIFLFEALNILGLGIGMIWVLLFKFFPSFAYKILPAAYKPTFKLIMEADIIIWKGKNFRNTNWIIEPYRVISRLYMPLVAIVFNKPIGCIGLSIWPLSNFLSRFALRKVLNKCFHVSVRENMSLINLKDIYGKHSPTPNVIKCPDLSFALLKRFTHKPANSSTNLTLNRVALTLVDWKGDGLNARERYIKALVSFIEYSFKRYNVRFEIIPQVTKDWEKADYIVEEILKRVNISIKNNITLVQPEHSVEGVIDYYKKSDFVIATRMHSAIFSLAVGTPIIAIPYDKGAKWSILDDLGYQNHLLPYNLIDGESLINKFEEIIQNRNDFMSIVSKNVKIQIKEVDNCLLCLKSDYKNIKHF
jgi:polysaccharide pyruvyl transferase WcaK-like protein